MTARIKGSTSVEALCTESWGWLAVLGERRAPREWQAAFPGPNQMVDSVTMAPLELVKLTELMERSRGRPEIKIGLVDGPVAMNHPGLATESIREIPGGSPGRCAQLASTACGHGTFVAGVLSGRRGSMAPAICPDCTLLVRPIFREATAEGAPLPDATPHDLAAAIVDCVEADANVVNLSLALAEASIRRERDLDDALDYAMTRGVLIVAAAGNQGAIGSSAITRHPWVIPVAACDLQGRPVGLSNLGSTIGRRGLRAPGDKITGLGAVGGSLISGGTSVAAPFVAGTIALLWSVYPAAHATRVKSAVTLSQLPRRTTIVPALLDAWSAYQSLLKDRP
jgi:subtilisin family serine protease